MHLTLLSLNVQHFSWGWVVEAYSAWVAALSYSNSRPLEKKQVFTINHTAMHKLSGQTCTWTWLKTSSIQKHVSDRTFQELSSQQATKDDENSLFFFSWEHAGFEKPWPAELLLSGAGWQKEPVFTGSARCLSCHKEQSPLSPIAEAPVFCQHLLNCYCLTIIYQARKNCRLFTVLDGQLFNPYRPVQWEDPILSILYEELPFYPSSFAS